MDKNNLYLVIIAVLILLLSLEKCGNGCSFIPVLPPAKVIRTVDTVYTVVTKDVPTYIPKWKTIIKYVHDTTKIIDTTYVIGDYYSTYFYQDSLINDTLCFYINDSISENKIKSRDLKYVMSFPTIKIHDVVIQNKNEYYIGLGLVGNQKNINYFGPEFLLRTKRKDVYGIGIGIDGNFNPNLSLRTYWKIGKK
jgi:hypothetical protein